jgi:glycerol-3-phosphate dehydrogenase
MRVEDYLFRRTTIGFRPDQGGKDAERVAREMAAELGWTAGKIAEELRNYEACVERTQAFRQPQN